jgi:hypothetical protein
MSVLFLLISLFLMTDQAFGNSCEFGVKVDGENLGLDLTPLAGLEIIMQEASPNDAYWLKYTPCVNNVSESCYSGKAMAAQMYGSNDPVGNGIIALWDDKQTQPRYSQTSDGKDKFTFEYPQLGVTCNDGCYNGRQQEISFICDPTADPYDKQQSSFYETQKIDGICYYHLDLYSKYGCPVSLGPTPAPTASPTLNVTCSGSCVGPIIVNEGGRNMIRYVMGDRSMVQINNNNEIILQHNAQVQIAKDGAPTYQPFMFMEYKLLGKTLSYTADLSRIGCSCNAALYLVTMPGYGSNGQPTPGKYGDYYCDANDVGGVWCWELDIQESNKYVTAVTPHSCDQAPGGPIYNCDRGGCGTNSHNVDGNGVCPGSNCKINTDNPFRYAVTFGSSTIDVRLTQGSSSFTFQACNNGGYISNMQQALNYGMVIVMSYWGDSYNTMQWLDGNTGCGGDCDTSGQAVFSDFQIS